MTPKDSDSPDLEFQSPRDDAWYGVHLVLQGEMLIVKYDNFSEEHDERCNAAEFKDPKQLKGLIERFRLASVQLQDYECKKVIEGITVCASYAFGIDDIRFYDAVVEEVKFKDHKFEEECTCVFVLFWLFGPNAGNKTDAVVADICLIDQTRTAGVNPRLFYFEKICKERHKMVPDVSASHKGTNDAIVINKSMSPQVASLARTPMEVKISVSPARTSKVRSMDHWERNGQDMDLGGKFGPKEDLRETSCSLFILIENMEKNLSPSEVVNFIKKHVCITSQAQVFPSLSSESYTRGIIIVDGEVELQKLSDFLHNPAHMILSSRGRPWVITEKKFWRGAPGAKLENLTLLPKSLENGDKIRIARSGTIEYERGKQLKNLYLEFADHLQGLHQRLSSEVNKILQQSNGPWEQR